MKRKEFLKRLLLGTSFLAVSGAAALEMLSSLSRRADQLPAQTVTGASASLPSSGSTSTSSKTATPSGYVLLAPLSALQGKTSAYFSHPVYGSSILIDFAGQWRAFSAICTHAGCEVQYTGQSLYCPCHSGYFSPTDGSVQGGPPPSPLTEYGIIVQSGSLYVSEARIN